MLRKDNQLQELYTVSVKNRYEQLCHEISTEESDISHMYSRLVKANDETARTLLPHKTKLKRENTAKDPEVNAAFDIYQLGPNVDTELNLQQKKRNLKEAYDQALENELNDMVIRVENADRRAQHSEAWRLINHIARRKPTKKNI